MKPFNRKDLTWTRQPKAYDISDNRITITTEPHTDLWQKTYYHFVNDNAPVLQMETEEGYFSFTVKTEFSDSHTRFNQCGTVLVVVGPIIVLKILSTVRPLTKCVSATCTKSRENPFRSQCLFP